MASSNINQGQLYLQCDICNNPVQFTCKRCAVKLCNTCVEPHMLTKSKKGHDVMKYSEQNKPEGGECLAHSQQQCRNFCKTCDIPICALCVLKNHETHDTCELSEKLDTVSDFIMKESERLQSMQLKLEKILDHINRRSAALPHAYKQSKGNISSHAREWHSDIDKAKSAMHEELDKMQKKHAGVLLKQKREFEEILKKLKKLKQTVFSLAKSKDVPALMELKLELENQQVPTFVEETRPAFFQPCKFNESLVTSYFGCIEKLESHKLSIDDLTQDNKISSLRQALDVPTVLSAFDTEFPADQEFNNRLFNIVPIGDDRVWAGGFSKKLKLFDLSGGLHDTVIITTIGLFLTLHEGHVVYTNGNDKTVKKIINGKVDTLFRTGEWRPHGITCTAEGDFLVCLRTSDTTESKVVRYSSSGDVLQEIQYNSQYKPLFKYPGNVVENGNGNICVADWDKKAVIVVDRFGIFRFSYTGNKASKENFKPSSLTTDNMCHIIITDFTNHKIHMLDRNGRFLRYIIPDQEIRNPRAVCVVREGELMVGEVLSGMSKRIKYLQ